jgi:predicted nucleic acid-binding protein
VRARGALRASWRSFGFEIADLDGDDVAPTVFIAAIRDPARLPALQRAATRRCYLTAITIAELYAGARSSRQTALIDRLALLIACDQRLLAPEADEWAAAGRSIVRAIVRRGAMEPRDHHPDVLLARIADRIGAAIVTDNVSVLRDRIALGRLDATVPLPESPV